MLSKHKSNKITVTLNKVIHDYLAISTVLGEHTLSANTRMYSWRLVSGSCSTHDVTCNHTVCHANPSRPPPVLNCTRVFRNTESWYRWHLFMAEIWKYIKYCYQPH